MARLLSPNSEILILALAGFVITIIEAMYLNLNANLQAAWKMTFPENILSGALENMVKSVISGIFILRGTTVHVHLASYLLLIYPVLKERRRMLLLIWLTVFGFRSILVNGAATAIGIATCSCLPEPHPACFEFLTAKGIELASSVYMWVVVNDFMHYLKGSYRTNETSVHRNSNMRRRFDPDDVNITRKYMAPEHSDGSELEYEGSYSPSISDSVSTIENSEELDRSDAMIAQAAVNWFFRLTLGMKFHGRTADRDEELTNKFLKMSPEEVEKFRQKLKLLIANNYILGDKFTEIVSNNQEENSEGSKFLANPGSINQEENSKVSFTKFSSIFADAPNIVPRLIHPIEFDTSETFIPKNTRNKAVQTDELPKKILRKIQKQEKEIMTSGLKNTLFRQ